MADFPNEPPKPGTFMDKVESINFNDPNSFHDRVLNVEDKKFYVQSGVLSLSSVYFRALFQNNFAEANQREIPLPEVSAESFECFLKMVYPGHFSENVYQVEPSILLELVFMSYRFLCPIVLSVAKKTIISFCSDHGMKRFDLVDFINLVLLHDLDDLKEFIIKALRDPSFVNEKNEEIMNAPEHIKNFVLNAFVEEKIDNNRHARVASRSRSPPYVPRSPSFSPPARPICRRRNSESPPPRWAYRRDHPGSPARRVYRRREDW